MSRSLVQHRFVQSLLEALVVVSFALIGCGPATVVPADGPPELATNSDGGKEKPVDAGAPRDAGSSSDAGSPIDAGPRSSDKTITRFELTTTDNVALSASVVGDISGSQITLNLPAGTVVTALIPTITVDGRSISPASGAAQDFTHSVNYQVTADDGSTADYTVTAVVAVPTPSCQTSAASCSLDVYNRAVAFASAHPTRSNGGSWDQYCGALMMEFGGFGVSASTAHIAYLNSTIESTDPTTAPIGAFHYFNIGSAGHVGVDLLGQGAVVFMASSHLGDAWGSSGYLGVNSVDGYTSASGAAYLGWSMTYNGHGQTLSGGGDCGAVSVPSGCAVPQSPTETSGVPDHAFVMRLQKFAADHGYGGAINGDSNASTWAGVQAGLQGYGYTGPVDGLPGPNTYKAFQRLAAANGYTGPINGVLGPNGFRAFAKYLNQAY